LERELEEINSDIPKIFRKESINKKVHKLNFFGWEKMEFSVNTGGIPIVNVVRDMKNGKWYDEDDRRNLGIYKCTYKSIYHARPAQASVTVYIESRNDPGNVLRIEIIKENLKNLYKEIGDLSSYVPKIEVDNEIISSQISSTKAGVLSQKEGVNEKLKSTKQDVEKYTSLIDEQKQRIAHIEDETLELIKNFREHQANYEAYIDIVKLLESESLLVKNFITDYETFIEEMEGFTVNKNDPPLSLDIIVDEIPDHLKDPINGKKN